MNTRNISIGILISVVAILLTGLLLDQAGKGRFGNAVKNVAENVTNGYGQ